MKGRLPCPASSLGLRLGVASGRQELIEAYQLVYRSYLDRGFIRPHPGRIVYHRAFGLPSSGTIIAAAAGRVVGTLTAVGDNPGGLQLESTFPGAVPALRRQGRRECEITCLAIEPVGDHRPGAIFLALTKYMLHYARQHRYDDLLMAIHPRHYRFYWRRYRAYLEGPVRPHACVEGNLAVCCRIDLRHLKRNMPPEMRKYYFTGVHRPAYYTGPAVTPADHRYFCRRCGLTAGLAWPDEQEDQDAA